MSSDDEEEGLGAIVVEPLEEELNDEDFLGEAGNFTQRIHSTKLISDSSTGNFLAKHRFDELRLTADGRGRWALLRESYARRGERPPLSPLAEDIELAPLGLAEHAQFSALADREKEGLCRLLRCWLALQL